MYLNPRHKAAAGSTPSAACVRPADASPEEDTMRLEHSFATLRQQRDTPEAIIIGRRSSLQEDVAGGHHRGLGNEPEASHASLRRREGEARAQKLAYTEHPHPNEEEGSYSFFNPSHDHGRSGASRLDRWERFPADRHDRVGEIRSREDRDRRGQSLGRLYHRRSSHDDYGDGEREQNMKRLSGSSYFSSPTARSAAAAAAAFSDAYRTASLALALASPTNFSKGNFAADGRRSFNFGGLLKGRAARKVAAHSRFAQSGGTEQSEAWWVANDGKCGDTASGVNPLFERDGKTLAEGTAAAAALPAPVQPEAPPRQSRGSTSSLSASSASVAQGNGVVANPLHPLPKMGLSSPSVQPAGVKRRDVLGGAKSSDPAFPAGGSPQGDGEGSTAADDDVSVGGRTDDCSGHNAMHVQGNSSSRTVSWRSIFTCWAGCSRATDVIDVASETITPIARSKKDGNGPGELWGKDRAPASTGGGADGVGPQRLSPTSKLAIDPAKPPASKTPVAVVENRRKKGRRRGRGGRPGRAGGERKRSPTRPRTDTACVFVPRPPASSAAEPVATSATALAAAVAAASSWSSSRSPSALAASKMATAAAAAAAEADSRNMKSAVDVAAAAAIAAALWQASGSFVSSPDSAAAPRASPSPQQFQTAVSSECAPMPTGWVRAATAMLWQASDSDIISPGSAAASIFDEFDAPLTLERRIIEASPSTVHRSPTIDETQELVTPVGGNGDEDGDGDSCRVGRREEQEPKHTTSAAAPQEGSHAVKSVPLRRQTEQPEHMDGAATSTASSEAPIRAPLRVGAFFFPPSNIAEMPPQNESDGPRTLLGLHAQELAPASAAIGPRPALKISATASHPSDQSPNGQPAAVAAAAAAAATTTTSAGVAAAALFASAGSQIARGKEVTNEEASHLLPGCDVAKGAFSDDGDKSGGSSTGGSKPGTESASPTSTSLTWESAAAPTKSAGTAVGVERVALPLPSGGDANPEEAKTAPPAISAPPVWVLQYVDKSKRFGQAFLLSDDSVVVRFRDNTVMVAEPRRTGGGGLGAVEYYVEAAAKKRSSLSTIGEGRPSVMRQQDDETALESTGGGGGGGGRRRRERKRHQWNQQQRKRDRHDHHPVRLRYTGQNVPPRLEKKWKLLACFCQRLYDLDGKRGGGAGAVPAEVVAGCGEQGAGAGGSSAEMMITPESKKTLLWGPSVVVEAYRRTRHSRLFVLSDSTVQIKFSDNTEVLLSGDQQAVTFVHADGRQRETLAFARAVEEERTDITRRVQYCRVAIRRLQEGQGSDRHGREGDTDVAEETNRHHKTKSHS